MTGRQLTYLGLAVLGAVLPWVFNVQYFGGDSASLVGFFAEGFTTAATSSMTMDLLVVFVAATVFVFVEVRQIGMQPRWFWMFLAVSMVVAVASALPLFLFVRERHLAAERAQVIASPEPVTPH